MNKICGVGINDADYKVTFYNNDGKRGHCPFYRRWSSMINRCYNGNFSSYNNSEVCEEWLTFSNFKTWMETQDWENKELDKDLLFPNNKVYCPTKCLFVPKELNSLFVDSKSNRGDYAIGVSFEKRRNKFESYISINNKKKHLGYYTDEYSAHFQWQIHKLNLLENSLSLFSDEIYLSIINLRIGKLKNDMENSSITESLHHF